MFLIDPVTVARDSLFLFQGDAVAYPAELELDELFFKYGVRFNKDIITDLYSAPIVLAQEKIQMLNIVLILGYITHLLKQTEHTL